MKNYLMNLHNKFFAIVVAMMVCVSAFAADQKPSWVDNLPESGEYIFAVGNGEGKKIDEAREKALQDARAKLAQIIEKKVASMCNDFTAKSKNGANLNKYSVDYAKKVAKDVVVGSQLKDSYTVGKTQYFALIAIRSKTLSQAIEQTKTVKKSQPDYNAVENDLENMVTSIKSRFNSEMADRVKAGKGKTYKEPAPEVTVQDGKEPSWVKRFPNDRAYYIGIGTGTDLEGAKANAVNTVASQIKVGIKSEIKDYMSENNGVSDEDVSVNIQLSVKDNIEDVEYFDAWQSPKGEFWVYARLNIATYKRKQQEKLENAKMVALDYLQKADEEESPVIAFKDAFLGYYFLSPYISKAVTGNYNGKQIVIINELMARMNKLSNRISIIQKEDDLMMGKVNAKPLKVGFTVYGNDERIAHLPLTFSVEEGAADITNEGVTDADGEVTCIVKKAKTNDSTFILNAAPNFEAVVMGLIDDPVQQKFFAKKVSQISVPKKQVVIEVERPTFGFRLVAADGFSSSQYKNKIDNLASSFKNKFSDKMKSEFVDDGAQFTIEMKVSGTVVQSDGDSNFIFARLIVAYKVFDNSNGTEFYAYVSDEVKQGANTDVKAVQKAIEKYVSSNLNKVVNEMVNKGIN